MVDVAPDGHLKGTCESFEDTFDLMVLILTLGLDVEVDAGGIGERLEEVKEHLGGNIANLFAMELGIPHEPRTSTEVESDLTEAIVHGEAEAVAADATLVAEGLEDAFAEGDAGVLDGVVFVDVKVTLDVDGEVHAGVTTYLLEHMVKEAEACGDVASACAVEVEGDLDVGLLGDTAHAGTTLACEEEGGDSIPVFSDEGTMAVLVSGEA